MLRRSADVATKELPRVVHVLSPNLLWPSVSVLQRLYLLSRIRRPELFGGSVGSRSATSRLRSGFTLVRRYFREDSSELFSLGTLAMCAFATDERFGG